MASHLTPSARLPGRPRWSARVIFLRQNTQHHHRVDCKRSPPIFAQGASPSQHLRIHALVVIITTNKIIISGIIIIYKPPASSPPSPAADAKDDEDKAAPVAKAAVGTATTGFDADVIARFLCVRKGNQERSEGGREGLGRRKWVRD